MVTENEAISVTTPGAAFPDVIFEQASNGRFAVWSRNEQKFIINDKLDMEASPFFEYQGVRYFPLERLPWLSFTVPLNYDSETQLLDDLKKFFEAHLDVPDERLFDIYATFTLATYRLEDWSVVPYLMFLGPLASGKTRALECLHRLCYRAIMAGSISAAALFRSVEAWHPTLLLDETEIYTREQFMEVRALLNAGYRKGQYAIRIIGSEQGTPKIGLFDVFGFKALAGTKALVGTLQSRCIVTNMSKATKPVNIFIDEEWAEKLRNQLIMYRFKNLGKSSPEFELGNFNNARVLELFISLLQVAPSEKVRNRILEYAYDLCKVGAEEELASVEARIVEALIKCEDRVEAGKIAVQTIVEAYNNGLPEAEQVDGRFIGRRMVALGFKKCRLTGGPRGFIYDRKLIDRLKIRYISPETSLMSLMSLSLGQSTETTPEKSLTETEKAEKTFLNHASGMPIQSDVSDISDISTEGVFTLQDIKALFWVDGEFTFHPCGICGYSKLTSWKAETFKGQLFWICEDCKQEWENQRKVE